VQLTDDRNQSPDWNSPRLSSRRDDKNKLVLRLITLKSITQGGGPSELGPSHENGEFHHHVLFI
jgi:hypothetical protein